MVSIIISHIEGQDAEPVLRSVLTQTSSNYECLLITNSKITVDNEKVHIYYTDSDSRLMHRLIGYEHSHGDFITFIDARDIIGCNFVENLYDKSVSDDIDMIYGGIETSDGSLNYKEQVIRGLPKYFIEKNHNVGFIGVLIRRSKYIQEGTDKYISDHCLIMPCLHNCNKIKTIPGVYYKLNDHEQEEYSKECSFVYKYRDIAYLTNFYMNYDYQLLDVYNYVQQLSLMYTELSTIESPEKLYIEYGTPWVYTLNTFLQYVDITQTEVKYHV